MPRILLNKKKYMLSDFSSWIRNRMRELHMNQAAAGKLIGASQAVFSYKLINHTFTLEEVITLLHEFEATQEEVVKLLSY